MPKPTIKLKIIVAIALIVALVSAVLATISVRQLQNETTSSITKQMQDVGDATAQFIDSWLSTRADMLLANESLIANQPNVDRELLVTKRAGHFLSVYAGFSDGRIAYGDKSEDWPADYDPRTRPWYKNANQSSKLIITEPYQDFDGSLVVSLAKSFNGRYQGVIAADVTVTDIVDQVLNLKLSNGFAFLVDGSNSIVAYRDTELSRQPLTELDAELTPAFIDSASRQGKLVTFDLKGEDKLLAAIDVPNTDWTLGIVEDKSDAYASVSEQITFVVVASVILFIVIAFIAGALIKQLLKPLSELTGAVHALSAGEGDLTQRINIVRQDEIGELAEYMNAFLAQLQQMVGKAVNQSMTLSQSAEECRTHALQSSQLVDKQQNDVDQIATAIHEMSATANEVASHAEDTATSAQQAEQSCQEGLSVVSDNRNAITQLADQVERATNVIRELDENAQSINQIIATIQGVAEQTNLLALNAAIEAARAGEQGRGFAVVADEVRVLSQRTHDSTEEIRNMIETLQHTTQRAVDDMMQSNNMATSSVERAEAASERLNQITTAISTISEMAIQIASAAEEQRAVTDDINRNTQAVKDLSYEIHQQASATGDQGESMAQAARDMHQDLSKFKV
ncbi:methyl-accepting chemotaxis protein [Salinivibrio sp. IB872]|uniref:methyl-accepting chemotaxis protein n=1 Tax=Salinivibrio sp. IB872 TaxID=1766123 RepID=UPI0009865DAC|nr:methyl-accepting chemotaxis protein [Salinivibrio sp. IB872]OOF23832.1 methyl-accepting chemotaxis protein [Salinivibrio sp. IB872]